MKPLRVTATLSFFAAGAETVLLDRRYPTQDVRHELLNGNKVATLSAMRPSRGIPISSLHTRAINGSEAPAHPPRSWPDIQRARGTTLITVDEHPLEWHMFHRRAGPRMIGTYDLKESMAVIILIQQQVLLVHKSIRRWQADGILELGASLPHDIRDAVAYVVRPSQQTLYRWFRQGHPAVSREDYERVAKSIKDVLADRGMQRQAITVGFGTAHEELRSERNTAVVEVISLRGDVAPKVWVDGFEVRPLSGLNRHHPAPPRIPGPGNPRLHYPAPPVYAPHLPAYAQPPPPPPPMPVPYPQVPQSQWTYGQSWHTQWQQPPGQFPQHPQNPHAQHPYGYNSHGHYAPGYHPR